MVCKPTRGSSILDLVLTTEPENMLVHVLECISDHNVVHCEYLLEKSKPKKATKTIFDYSRANVEAILEELSSFSVWFLQTMACRNTNDNWLAIRRKLTELKQKHVPKIEIVDSTHSTWFTSQVKRAINKKKRLYSKAKSSNSDGDWQRYREQSNKCKAEIEASKEKFFNGDIVSMIINNPKKFWKVINPKHPSQSTLPIVKNGVLLSPSEAATELNSFFSSVFTKEKPMPPDLTFTSINASMNDLIITPEGIESAINRLSINSAPGPDGICPKILKMTKPIIYLIFAALFQQSLDTGIVPDDWNIGCITPIYKSGDRSMPSNNRPISLTSIPGKLLEHIISSAVMKYLSKNNFFFNNQHGFQKGHSCETQLFELITDLHQAVHDSLKIEAIFIDFKKAFDKVPHARLLMKLSRLNIHSKIITWITSFLTNRYQFVSVSGQSSALTKVKSGVPQGSVLGPILFLIYINDISKNIYSTVRLFADDCVLYRQINTSEDSNILQADLSKISLWCEQWQMEINVSKTKAMTFTRSSNVQFTSYFMNNLCIENVNTLKYLGVHLSSNLTWNDHIDEIISKASKTLGFIRRNLYSANQSTKLLAYTSLVRSKMEYASIIWNPNQTYLINKLESLQNKAARFITKNYSRTSSITAIKDSIQLPSLEKRRMLALLSHFHRMYHTPSSFTASHIKPPHQIFPRLDHPFKVRPMFARTNLLRQSPLFLAIYHWNKLPKEIAAICDHELFVAQFKHNLNAIV